MASNNQYLILRHEDAKFRHLVPRFVFRRKLTTSNFAEHSSSTIELHEHRIDPITLLTLVLQKLLSAISTPLRWIGYIVEFVLNFFSINGGPLSILWRLITFRLVLPWNRNSPLFQTMIGQIDGRYDLNTSIHINHMHLLNHIHGVTASPITLSIMAAKVAYENAANIRDVVTKHWKMHYVRFFSCYNKYLENRATQAFIFTDKEEDANAIVLAFRGTEPFNALDWITDVDLSWTGMGNMGRVHLGFMRALGLQDEKDIEKGFPKEYQDSEEGKPLAYYVIRESLKLLIEKHKRAKIIITGHSLGGALAILFPSILALHEESEILGRVHGVLTYGQPRVGDADFGRYMQAVLGKRYHRMVYKFDVVPRVPFDKPPVAQFKHFGTCIYFKSWYDGEVVDESPNPNYLDPMYMFSMHFGAFNDLVRVIMLGLARVKDFEESIVSILYRACGLLLPGIACHSPRDYVNGGKMATIIRRIKDGNY